MSKFQDAGEPTGQTQVWQNTLPYLSQIAYYEYVLSRAIFSKNAREATEAADHLLLLIDRNFQNKKTLIERGEKVQELITQAREQLRKEANMKGTARGIQATKQQANYQAYEHAREAYRELGRLIYDLELVFKKGTDPNDIWAEG